MSPLVTIRHEDGYWSVFVNGTRLIDRESFAVVDRVRYYLEHPEIWEHAESCEVANGIRRWLASHHNTGA